MTSTKKSIEISFGSELELFMNYRVLLSQGEIACDDKHVLFYVDATHPRHFRQRFAGYTSTVLIPVELCHFLLFTRQFVDARDLDKDMSSVLAVLHAPLPPSTRPRIYLGRDDFEHLFSGRSLHAATDHRGRRTHIDYDDDSAVGSVFRLTLHPTPKSPHDIYIKDRVGASGVMIYEGRGWLR